MRIFLLMLLLTVSATATTLPTMAGFYTLYADTTTLYAECGVANERSTCTIIANGAVVLERIVPKERLVKSNECLLDPYNVHTVIKHAYDMIIKMEMTEVKTNYIQPYGNGFRFATDGTRYTPSLLAQGRIGRQWLYMSDINCVTLTAPELKMFTEWSYVEVDRTEYDMFVFITNTEGNFNVRVFNGLSDIISDKCVTYGGVKRCLITEPPKECNTVRKSSNCYIEV